MHEWRSILKLTPINEVLNRHRFVVGILAALECSLASSGVVLSAGYLPHYI